MVAHPTRRIGETQRPTVVQAAPAIADYVTREGQKQRVDARRLLHWSGFRHTTAFHPATHAVLRMNVSFEPVWHVGLPMIAFDFDPRAGSTMKTTSVYSKQAASTCGPVLSHLSEAVSAAHQSSSAARTGHTASQGQRAADITPSFPSGLSAATGGCRSSDICALRQAICARSGVRLAPWPCTCLGVGSICRSC